MANKHLTYIEFHAESDFPTAGNVVADVLFTYTIEELPELGDSLEAVRLPVSASMTLGQIFQDARNLVSGTLASAGTGGHTIIDG